MWRRRTTFPRKEHRPRAVRGADPGPSDGKRAALERVPARGPVASQAAEASIWTAVERASLALSRQPQDPAAHEQLRYAHQLATAMLRGGRADLGAWAVLRATEWRLAAIARHEFPIDLGYRRDYWPGGAPLRAGDALGLEAAISYLEADPWAHGTGYIKEHLLTQLSRLDLSDDQQRRLQQVVLTVVEGRDRREFRSFCRLARHVADCELRAALEERLEHPAGRVRRHAQWVLDALDGKPRRPRF